MEQIQKLKAYYQTAVDFVTVHPAVAVSAIAALVVMTIVAGIL
jgi:hypothetical protein